MEILMILDFDIMPDVPDLLSEHVDSLLLIDKTYIDRPCGFKTVAGT